MHAPSLNVAVFYCSSGSLWHETASDSPLKFFMNMIFNFAHPSWENYQLEGRHACRLVVGVTAGIGDPWAEEGESLACIAWSALSSVDNLISCCARALWTCSPRISPWWEIVVQSVLKSASRSRDLPDCSIMVTSKIKHILKWEREDFT